MGKRIGFFGGSYNPVHLGHVKLAEAIARSGVVDEVWLSLSPLNPFKEGRREELVADSDRLAMLRLAVKGIPGLRVTDVELSMPRPSYTIDTLSELQRRHPDYTFRIIIGSDNLEGLPRWKESELLVARYPPIVYPRPGYPAAQAMDGLPVYDISSTQIRESFEKGVPATHFLAPDVVDYIKEHHLYGVC